MTYRMQAQTTIYCTKVASKFIDVEVDPNKSNWVDFWTSSRIGSVLLGTVDSPSNVELKNDFTASRLKTDFCLCTSGSVVFQYLIVIVNARFLERPQKRSRGNQLIHMRLTRTKSTGNGKYPESQAGRQTVRGLWWMTFGVETGEECMGKRMNQDSIC